MFGQGGGPGSPRVRRGRGRSRRGHQRPDEAVAAVPSDQFAAGVAARRSPAHLHSSQGKGGDGGLLVQGLIIDRNAL